MRTLLISLLLSISMAQANILPGWEGSDPASTAIVDHSNWQHFLDTYLETDAFGQTYFSYSKVTRTDRKALVLYIKALEAINPLKLNADEQKAYWFNLYNALTVSVILDAYPIASIRDIGSRFAGLIKSGPWKLDVTTINNRALSLDDIEHNIVRPKFQDYRVHFAFNCASMGCPNLAHTAYSGRNIETLLAEAERAFINHQRGVRIQHGQLIVSKIFDWYQSDFVNDEKELANFLAQSAEPKLAAQLKGYRGNIKYEYDWSLNEVFENK